MRTRKLDMALCGTLFAVQMASAQQPMALVGNNGEINIISVSSVNYATFNFNADDVMFTISNDGIERVDTNLITTTCTVELSAESNVKTLSITPKVGVCYTKHNKIPTIEDHCLFLGSELKSYTFSLSDLFSGTTYYFCTFVKLAGSVFYGNVTKATTLGTAPIDNNKTINGHQFIDLGLPSGLLWAETNVGAEGPADDGNYYAWGETEPKSYYDWSTYKHCTSYDNMTKYNSSDGKTILDQEDDAAYVNWGSACRMPTDDEFTELRNASNCTWTWTSMTTSGGSSINGYKVTSVKNDNFIFLPASGYRRIGNLNGHGSRGGYWSSTLNSSTSSYASDLSFYSSECSQYFGSSRYFGSTVRPVAEP